MINYIHQYGDQIELDRKIKSSEVMHDLERFAGEWSQYNTFKPWISRKGLCVINETGKTGPGPALNSLSEWNKAHMTSFKETDFNEPTSVYHSINQLKFALTDILPYCVRTHFIKLPPGGFFPQHRDHRGRDHSSFRLIVPIENCNPPETRFMIEDKTLYWNHGTMYAVNTTKPHTLFNASASLDSIWLVINATLCDYMIDFVTNHLSCR